MSAQIIDFNVASDLTDADIEQIRGFAYSLIETGRLTGTSVVVCEDGTRSVALLGRDGWSVCGIGRDRQGYLAFGADGETMTAGQDSLEAVLRLV